MKVMNVHGSTWIAVAAIAIVVVWVGFVFTGGEGETSKPDAKQVKAQIIEAKRKTKIDEMKRRQSRKDSVETKREKPKMLDLEEEEEAKLNDFSRKVLRELQAALDAENFAAVSRLAQKMMEIPPDPMFGADGVDSLLRRKAVEALGWFGGRALPELVGMLGDADPDIVQATFDQFTLALEDISLSDYERADIVVMASKVLTNVEDLEMLFMEINNMRHSVGADALVQICLEGTEQAKSLMPDAIEFFTGEDNLVSVEDVEKWLKENPDDEYDDDLYGGDKDA